MIRIPEAWPQVTIMRAVMGLIGLIAVGFILWRFLIFPFFIQPQKMAEEKGGRLVAEEQVKAGENIAAETIKTIKERDVYREHTREIVERRQEEVNNAWKGESVGKEVDAAGAAALCELHVDLCRHPEQPAEVQPLR